MNYQHSQQLLSIVDRGSSEQVFVSVTIQNKKRKLFNFCLFEDVIAKISSTTV